MLYRFYVALKSAKPLDLKVAPLSENRCVLVLVVEVKRGKRGAKDNGAQKFIGSKIMRSWSSIRWKLRRPHH